MATDLVLRTLKHVWETLEPFGIPMGVMGGIAVAAWKHARATLDVDLLIGTDDYHRQALDRRVLLPLSGLSASLAVLACEDLILHKLLAGRIIDRADSAALLRVNRDSLDTAYLFHWASSLDLQAELAEVWEEAFPNEPFPGTNRWRSAILV